MSTKTIKCPNCGALVTNTMNCEYCDSILVRFADEDQQDDLAEFKSIIASEDETMLTTATNVLKNGIWTDERAPIAMAWFVDGSSEELVEYKDGEIMISMCAERGEDFFEKYKLVPAPILKLFILEKTELLDKSDLNSQVRTYTAHLGKDFKDAAVVWLKVMRAVANSRGIQWVPNEIQFENKFGQYNYKGERIGDSEMGEDVFISQEERDRRVLKQEERDRRARANSDRHLSDNNSLQEAINSDQSISSAKNWIKNNKITTLIIVAALIVLLFLVAEC